MTDQTTTPDVETVDLVYRVERDETGDPDTKLLTYGTQRIDVDDVPAYVVQRAYESRIAHSYSGPLTVAVWRARKDEHYRLPVPDNASTYGFPTGRPTADELDLDHERDDREPCGENMCHCDCGQGHVCACDCWRCGYCGQHADHCYCDDDEEDGDEEWQEGTCDNCYGSTLEELSAALNGPGITPVCACAIGQGAAPSECHCGPEED